MRIKRQFANVTLLFSCPCRADTPTPCDKVTFSGFDAANHASLNAVFTKSSKVADNSTSKPIYASRDNYLLFWCDSEGIWMITNSIGNIPTCVGMAKKKDNTSYTKSADWQGLRTQRCGDYQVNLQCVTVTM